MKKKSLSQATREQIIESLAEYFKENVTDTVDFKEAFAERRYDLECEIIDEMTEEYSDGLDVATDDELLQAQSQLNVKKEALESSNDKKTHQVFTPDGFSPTHYSS